MAETMILGTVIEKCVDFVFRHTYQELQYFWKFKSNIESVSTSMTRLETTLEQINSRINAAEDNLEEIKSEVTRWVDDVLAMKDIVDKIKEDKGRATHMGCFYNFKCPNLNVRYSLSKKAAAKTIEIADLQVKGEFPLVGYPAPIEQRPFTSPLEVIGFRSRLQVEERVMKALLDDEIPVLAVCGMGGVGKTTMVKKIADQIKKGNHFDEVVMAVVSKNYDPIHVQQQLAEKLRMEFKETTLDARADRLHKKFIDDKKRILLIMDDLWEEMDLGTIGIPSEVDNKGIKLLLTSRSREVCSLMKVQEIIEVGVLIDDEAWDLFMKHANISDDFDVLEGYPKKVALKCQGLPLAIEVIGKTLKDRKELSEWRDALQQLESGQGSHTSKDKYAKVYSSLEWSVNYLESPCRSLLLVCSLFPAACEIQIEDLVRYSKGLQLFTDIEKMAQFRDRVETFCNELKECYLLIACDNHCVKLHDVVRDTCLRIVSKGDNVYMVSHSGLREWPHRDTYESYTAISLTFDDLDEFPSGVMCSSLQLLRLSSHGSKSMKITTSFLQAMEKVRVLNINGCGVQLPLRSLQSSISLRTLNLHNCELVGDLSELLEGLVKLEVLSFFKSTYHGNWPKEIAELTNLKSLDLRFYYGPGNSFPTGILIHLEKLEELYMGFYSDMQLPESYGIIKETGSLSNLNTIEILSCNSDFLAVLVENLDVERLLRFYISPSHEECSPYHFSRTVIVHETKMDKLLEPKMNVLLNKVDDLLNLSGVTGEIKYFCNNTSSCIRAGVFVYLKRLSISGAKYLEELCHGNIPPGSFVRLEQVTLYDVPLLSCLWGPIKPPCLGNLTTLVISGGEMLRSLFLRSSVKCFARLRLIEISSCPKLEALVSCEGQIVEDIVEDKVEFPELEVVDLKDVYSFKTFSSEPDAHMVSLCSTNSNISIFPKLRFLKISGSRHLHVVDVIKNGQNLSSLDISECFSLEECFDFDCWPKEITGGEAAENVFHNLDSLTLFWLPSLRHLWRKLPEGAVAFRNLTSLTISRCESLKQLLTQSMAKMLANLKRLHIKECRELEAIVGLDEASPLGKASASTGEMIFERLEDLELSYLPQLTNFRRMFPEGTVSLQKLSTLKIVGCFGFRYLFTSHMVKTLTSLKSLEIYSCDKMESIIGSEEVDEDATNEVVDGKEEILLPELFQLTLMFLPKFRMLCFQSVDLALPKWDNIFIKHCPKLRRFCAGHLIAPELKRINFTRYKALDMETTRKCLKDCELGIRCISCAIYLPDWTCDHLSEGSSTNMNNEDDTDSS
ncbi:antimicrobial response protein [Lithospermum erythrorhizon]|uniref:Antimicrobial response protein n=1 Tax=Lithospermum erythrorhizon TaxID=34254 RepID=A0AAV3QEI8_LITER